MDNDNDNDDDLDYDMGGEERDIANILAKNTMNNDEFNEYQETARILSNITNDGIKIDNIIGMMTLSSNQMKANKIPNDITNNVKSIQNNIAKRLLTSSLPSLSSSSPSLPSSSSPLLSWKDFPSCLPEDNDVIYRTSGISLIDGMLFERGYPMGHVINIIGDINAGKTQSVLVTAACNAIQGQIVLLIDLTNGMDMRGRLESIIKFYLRILSGNNNPKEDFKAAIGDALNRITIMKVFNPWDLLDMLTKVNTEIENSYDIIIVDCLSTVFLPYMNTSKGTELSSYGQPNQNPKNISNDNVSIDSLISSTLIMLRSFCNNNSTVIITNNSINDKHTSRTNQLRDIPDYLFNDMVDFIFTLEKNDIGNVVNLIHVKCILRPPWYQNDEYGNRNDLVSGMIDLSSFETFS